MFKFLLILSLGIAIGYSYGWKDAQRNEQPITERLVERIGGDNKSNMNSDVDSKMQAVERH